MFSSSPADVRCWRIHSRNLVNPDAAAHHRADLPERGVKNCQTGLIFGHQAAQHALEVRVRRLSPNQHRIGRRTF
jgi:hypothetical protein